MRLHATVSKDGRTLELASILRDASHQRATLLRMRPSCGGGIP